MEDLEKKHKWKSSLPEGDFKKYTTIAIITFATICGCILFFFLLYRYNGFAQNWQKLMQILQPIIMGFIVAYLINPIMMFLERYLYLYLHPRMKNEKKAKKTARSLGTVGALLFLLLIIFLLLNMVIPELIKSIQNMMVNLPSETREFTDWAEKFLEGDSPLAQLLGTDLAGVLNYANDVFQKQVFPQINSHLLSITSSAINAVKGLFNFVIGLIIAVYLLTGKETFIGQAKKTLYAILPAEYGNRVIQMMRISNKMFGGFISGKILDSFIIGVLCYLGLLILRMPYSLLVAVIVGVTNVVPFFGPYVGAVPSVILIALAEPVKGLYFLIFILVLQQVDGNIIGPKILGDSTGLSSFWVIFAILVGGGLFGFMGMLLGVPAFAVIYHLIRETIHFILQKKNLPPDTEDYIWMQDIDTLTGKIHYEEKE